MSDCQGEDPISVLVELCDRDARQALGMVPPGDGPWKPVTDHYRQYARAVIEAYVSRTEAEILSLSQERDRLREVNEVRLERNRRQGERIAELCEALEPFAKAEPDFEHVLFDHVEVAHSTAAGQITMADLRRARAALQKEPS